MENGKKFKHLKLDYSRIPIPNTPLNGSISGGLRTIPYFKTDVDFGVGYIYENFIAGATLRHVNNPKWEVGGGYPSFFLNRELNLMSSYTFSFFDDQFQLRPSAYVHTFQNLFEAMPTLSLGYKNAVFLGFSYYVFDQKRNNNFPHDLCFENNGTNHEHASSWNHPSARPTSTQYTREEFVEGLPCCR